MTAPASQNPSASPRTDGLAGLRVLITAGAGGIEALTKELCDAAAIPTAAWERFDSAEAALSFVRWRGAPIVVKADGLAAGKGVVVAETVAEAEAAIAATKTALEGTDEDALKQATERLTQAAMKIGETMYKAEAAAQQAGAQPGAALLLGAVPEVVADGHAEAVGEQVRDTEHQHETRG